MSDFIVRKLLHALCLSYLLSKWTDWAYLPGDRQGGDNLSHLHSASADLNLLVKSLYQIQDQ